MGITSFRVLVCGFFLLLPSSIGAAAPEPEKILPATTKALVATHHLDSLQQAWSRTSIGKMVADPALKPFLDEVRQRGDEQSRGKLPPQGLWWEEIEAASAGPAAIAILPDGKGGTTTVLLLNVTGREEQAQAILAKRAADFARLQITSRTQNLLQTDVASYHYRVREGQIERQRSRYYALKGSLLIVAEQEAVVRDLLTHVVSPGNDRLAQWPAFRATVSNEQTMPTAGFYWYADPFGLHSLRPKPALAADGKQPEPDRLDLLGENGFAVIQGVGGYVDLMAGGGSFEFMAITRVYAPGKLEQAGRLLSFQPAKSLAPPAWIPSDVASLTSVNWHLPTALEGYGSWFDITEGMGDTGTFDAILEDIRREKDAPQVDVRKEIIDRLKGPVHAVTFADSSPRRPPGTSENAAGSWLYCVATSDEAALALAMRKMLHGDADVLKPPRKIGSSDVWVYRPDSGATWLGPNLANVAITVARGHWVVASDFETLQRVLAPKQAVSAVTSSEGWKSTSERIADFQGDAIAAQFRDLPTSLASTYAALKAGRIQEESTFVGRLLTIWLDQIAPRNVASTTQGPKSAATSPPHALDFAKLPPFAALHSHLGAFAAETVALPDGWLQMSVIQGPGTMRGSR